MDDFSSMLHAIAPLIFASACWLYLFLRLSRTSTRVPLMDVGLTYASVVLLYTVVPIISALVLGESANPLTDNRLMVYRPSRSEVGDFMWRYVAVLAGFVGTYPLIWRQELRIALDFESTKRYWRVTLTFVIGLTIYFLILSLTSGVAYRGTFDEGFLDSAEKYAALPILARQISGRLAGVLLATKITLVIIIVGQFRKPMWRYGGLCWCFYEFIIPFIDLGSRSSSLFVIFTFIIAYHTFVRPIPSGAIVLGGCVVIAVFLIQGIVRAEGAQALLEEFGVLTALLSSNEFQSVFGTAYDIHMRQEVGDLEIPWQIYFADFFRLLPQQMFPIQKVDQAEWYLEMIGYSGEGVGFTFGTVSEGVIGFGILELAVRGVVLGVVLGFIHNFVCRRGNGFIVIFFYVWLCTRVYLSIRASTFYWLSSVLFEFAPFALVIYLLRSGSKWTRNVAWKT